MKNNQLKNAIKAMVILIAFFATIAFFTSCTKTEVIEKNIINEPEKNQDLMYFTNRTTFSRYSVTYRYHAALSSPKDSLFYYTKFSASTDSTPIRFKWIVPQSHELANSPVFVIISRNPPKDGEEPQ